MRPDTAQAEALPALASSRLIDFERASIVTLRSVPPQHALVVSGTKPFLNMDVTLAPLVYVRRPEYWGIEVVGRVPGEIALPATAPYRVSIPLAGITGTKGIEVIGANGTQRLDVEATPARPTAAPAVFELRGGDIELEYHSPAAPGGRRLCFRDGEHDRIFGEDEIRAHDGELGELVTVTLRDAPDEPLVKLTLAVPALDFGGDAQIAVTTVALVSTDRRTAFVAPPGPRGQLVAYADIALAGTASRAARSTPRELVFSRDDRPVDGELRELRIVSEDRSSYTATLRTARLDRVNQQEIDETEQLASGLTCTITDAEVRCGRDDRPVDGVLKELVVARDDEGTFDATLRTAFFDRLDGREVDETAAIATNLTRRP